MFLLPWGLRLRLGFLCSSQLCLLELRTPYRQTILNWWTPLVVHWCYEKPVSDWIKSQLGGLIAHPLEDQSKILHGVRISRKPRACCWAAFPAFSSHPSPPIFAGRCWSPAVTISCSTSREPAVIAEWLLSTKGSRAHLISKVWFEKLPMDYRASSAGCIMLMGIH